MKILVFIKQVPNTDNVKLDPATGNLRRDGVESVMNPLDAHALEAAIQLKEKYGATVAAVSMGPPQAADTLKKALALGCDEAYLLSDRAFGGADTYATAYTLSKAAEKIGGYDLLLFGRNATDGDTAQTGPAAAAFLDLPQATLVSKLDLQDGWLYCERALEEGREKLKIKLPAVAAVCDEINTPRLPSLINIMKAAKKPITVWGAEDIGADKSLCGTAGSPSSTKKVFEPPRRNTNTRYFTGTPEEMAAQFVDMLSDEHLL